MMICLTQGSAVKEFLMTASDGKQFIAIYKNEGNAVTYRAHAPCAMLFTPFSSLRGDSLDHLLTV